MNLIFPCIGYLAIHLRIQTRWIWQRLQLRYVSQFKIRFKYSYGINRNNLLICMKLKFYARDVSSLCQTALCRIAEVGNQDSHITEVFCSSSRHTLHWSMVISSAP